MTINKISDDVFEITETKQEVTKVSKSATEEDLIFFESEVVRLKALLELLK